jgi:CRP-like cAMP-binding protein
VSSGRRILLRVKSEIDCPVFRPGDQMVIEPPRVDMASSTDVCTYAIARYFEEFGYFDCTTDKPVRMAEFRCPRAENPVTFQVEEVEARYKPLPVLSNARDNIPAAVGHLRTIPIFRALPAAFLAQLANRMRIEGYRDGDIVVQRGHPGDALYVVHSGVLEVVGYAEHDVSSVVTRLKSKDCFGEVSLLTGAPAAASVVARGPVTLLAIGKDDFESMLRENPFMAARFTRLLASRLMAANFLLVREGSKSFSGKLSVMNLVTVIQVLSDSNRSGTLIVDRNGTKATIGFNNGHIFDVAFGNKIGEDALYTILPWDDGDFYLDPAQIPETDTIQNGVMGLLMEGMRRIDEARREAGLEQQMPSGDIF